MKKILIMALNFVFLTQGAIADDLIGSRYSIKRIPKEYDKIAFKLCDTVYGKCNYIGREHGYSAVELDTISQYELTEARVKVGGALLIGAVGFVAGYFTFFVAADALLAADIIGTGALAGEKAFMFGVFGGAGGAATPLYLKKLNPFHQYDQANVLKTEGIFTNQVLVMNDEDILTTASLMQEILN